MTKQSMGELAADLESRGYVERVAHPGDRRGRMVSWRPSTRALGVDRFAELGRLLEELSSRA